MGIFSSPMPPHGRQRGVGSNLLSYCLDQLTCDPANRVSSSVPSRRGVEAALPRAPADGGQCQFSHPEVFRISFPTLVTLVDGRELDGVEGGELMVRMH